MNKEIRICTLTLTTLLVSLSISASAKEAKPKLPDLLKACAVECPGSKTLKDVLSCAEKKEDDAEFKKSACGKEHATYEKLTKAHHDHDHGHEHEHDSTSDKKKN